MRLINSFSLLPLLAFFSSSSVVRSAEDEEGTKLVGNTITRTDISSLADIAKDVRDMDTYCSESNVEQARDIYKDGKYGEYSLRYLATHAHHINNDLTFAFQMYGLSGGKPEDAANYELFASQYIDKLFDEGNCGPAVLASLELTLWMHVSYVNWDLLRSCSIAADPEFDNLAAGVDNLPGKADQIVAYWVGSLQDAPDGTDGYSLYSKANIAGANFGTNVFSGSRANKNILDAYEVISGILSQEDACTSDFTKLKTSEALWPALVDISRQMLVPQIQQLIYAMLEENYDGVGIHARIVVPQLSQCRYSNYKFLKEVLLDNPYDSSNFHKTLKALQSSYSCLGLSCRDIGIPHEFNDSSLGCNEYSDVPTLAGYPAGSYVTEESKIDLDIHQINVLTQFDHDEFWESAKYIYLFGKNSMIDDYYADDDEVLNDKYLSLHSLAIDGSRDQALFYGEFISYFDDPNYADTIVRDTFDNTGRWMNKPRVQRAAVIRVTLQAKIMYMHILSKLNQAVSSCVSRAVPRIDNLPEDEGVIDAWDEVAAFIIGSLEGEEIGGSSDFNDGTSLWGLANSRAIEFGRTNEQGYAISNAAIYNLLLAGKGKISAQSCANLDRTAFGIAHLLFIPLFQSVVKYAIVNQYEIASSDDADIALGETFANSVIPVLNHYDPVSARTLVDNMVPTDEFQNLVQSGPQAVADAFLAVADDFNIECEYIGKSYEVDACRHYQSVLKSSSASRVSVVFAGILSTVGIALLM